ncbi:hypothetical protein [Halosimplex salinum]|uniref:hypothetical protein n=1 Tax=Halosimplex salinum TaxID=1710538 RepID=UPI000F48649E|nr:hypothetical protein [Halosimplex salinum]
MGLLDKIFDRGSDSGQEAEPPQESQPDLVIDDTSGTGFVHGTYQGERVTFEQEHSPNGDWTCLYARSAVTDKSPVVLLDADGQTHYAITVTRPENVAVANTGVIAVTDIGPADDQELGGEFAVVDGSGEIIIEHEFEANIWECAIADDGRYASTSTHNPDRAVYLFDLERGELAARHESDYNAPAQEFGYIDGEHVLYILDGDERYRGISPDGETVWRSEELDNAERFEDLLEERKDADPAEAVELLEAAYELVEDENEKKRVARDLADSYWNRASELRKEEGDTDRWWSHLNKAKEYYFDVLSWRDGQKGVAKVQRKQAKYHLKEGNEEMALELLQNIGDIGDEHNIDLLTDADKEKIERLS